MRYLQNCTKDPRTLTGRNGPGIVALPLAPGETKPVSEDTYRVLLSNPVVKRFVQLQLIREVKDKPAKIKADNQVTKVEVAKAAAKKVKAKKVKARVKASIVEDDLGID